MNLSSWDVYNVKPQNTYLKVNLLAYQETVLVLVMVKLHVLFVRKTRLLVSINYGLKYF